MSGAGSATSAEGGGSAPSQNWGGNLGAIVQFLQSKGLNNYAIAGILGNLKVESGLSTSAYNAGEGAIGIAQWEGGRRSALQSYAASHGGKETDLNMQLGYLWHELTTGYSSVLSQLQNATSATQAATLWDAHYEVSAGTTRQERISNANAYFTGGFKSIGGETTGGTGGAGLGGGGSAAGGGGATMQDYQGVDSLGSLLKSVPELNKLLQTAQAGDWSTSKFQNSVENSAWWKTHSQTARSAIVQRANDPASWKQLWGNTANSVRDLGKQLGFNLDTNTIWAIANNALLTGNDTNKQWLSEQLSQHENYGKIKNLNGLQGGMAQTAQQLESMAGDYGYTWTPAQLAQKAQAILAGTTTIDTYKQNLITWAKSAFPGLSKQIDAGSTVKDLAAPYVQSMSNLLEVDPTSLTTYDPTIRKALQGASTKAGEPPTAAPLWQFENDLRKDPRWAYTDNAHASMATTAVQLGQAWGFNG